LPFFAACPPNNAPLAGTSSRNDLKIALSSGWAPADQGGHEDLLAADALNASAWIRRNRAGVMSLNTE
jgi:hypothetical protein